MSVPGQHQHPYGQPDPSQYIQPGPPGPPQHFKAPVGPPAQRVVVTDFDMPFTSMVVLMVKWALATIPAFLFLAVGAWILSALFT